MSVTLANIRAPPSPKGHYLARNKDISVHPLSINIENMDIQNTYVTVSLAALLFVIGLIGLFALSLSNKRTVCVKNSQGTFIAGDGNSDVSAHIMQPQNDTTSTPAWRKIATVVAWLAALAGPLIAALAYWFPRAGV